MEVHYRKAYGIQSILHRFVHNKNAPGESLDLTKPEDMSLNTINTGVGKQDGIATTNNIFGKAPWNNEIFSGGEQTVTYLASEHDYKKFGNIKREDLKSVTQQKGDPNADPASDYLQTGILTPWKRYIAWDKRRGAYGLYDIDEQATHWDLFDHDGSVFTTKLNYDIPNSERLRDAQVNGLVNGNYFHGFFTNFRPTMPVKTEYAHRDENKNIHKLCLSFWQPGRSGLDFYREWDSGVYFVHDWSQQDPAGRTIKKRGRGGCYVIPVTDVVVQATDGVVREHPFTMEAGRPYEMVSDELTIATGYNTWVVMIYNV